MFIPAWLVVIAVIVIFFYIQNKKKKSASEDMWDQAGASKAQVLEKSPLLEGYLEDERDMVNAMERDMVRLRERYKHDSQKQNEIARDWMDYSKAVAEIKFAREMLDVDNGDNAYDNYGERTKESRIAIQEIAKRVEKELGDDSNSKTIHDRLEKQAIAINEIGEKNNAK